MDKAPDAFRTISEVAEDLDLPQHVLRFWETRFQQIKPLKRGGGRRYYRPDDVELLKGIRYYLYGEGYTIKGVQRILKERGVKHVIDLGRAQTENYAPPVATLQKVPEPREEPAIDDWPEALPPSQLKQTFVRPLPFGPIIDDEVEAEEAPAATGGLFAPQRVEPRDEPRPSPPREPVMPVERVQPAAAAPAAPRAAPSMPVATPLTLPRMPAEDLRRLKAALFELGECKRILDAAR